MTADPLHTVDPSEVARLTSSPEFNAGWTYGRAFGHAEARLQHDVVDEVVHRLTADAERRAVVHALASSTPLLELTHRRYPGPGADHLRQRIAAQAHWLATSWTAAT